MTIPKWVATLTANEMWVYGLAFAFITTAFFTWVGIIVTHRLTSGQSKNDMLRAAVIAYKKAFSTEIAAISNNSYAIDTFASAFERHEAAVDTVRPILPEDYQRELQKAWDEYCGKGSGLDGKDYVAACNMSLYSTDQELFIGLKKRFHTLHSCLDDLL